MEGLCQGDSHGQRSPGQRGGVHVFFGYIGYNERRSMSGRYASYWNAFLLLLLFK